MLPLILQIQFRKKAMLRAFSTRKYERLGGDGNGNGGSDHNNPPSLLAGSLKRVTSLPVKLSTSSSRKLAPEPDPPANQASKQFKEATKKAGNVHPLLGSFDPRRRKKATATPEFARYLQYIKEGGVWNEKSDGPSIYYHT